MRKPTFCICKNKDADQLRGNRKADQRLCFSYIDSTLPLLSKSEISSFYQSSVTVQPGLCRTWSKTRALVFSLRGSYIEPWNLGFSKRDILLSRKGKSKALINLHRSLADLHLCCLFFRHMYTKSRVSHEMAHIMYTYSGEKLN